MNIILNEWLDRSTAKVFLYHNNICVYLCKNVKDNSWKIIQAPNLQEVWNTKHLCTGNIWLEHKLCNISNCKLESEAVKSC